MSTTTFAPRSTASPAVATLSWRTHTMRRAAFVFLGMVATLAYCMLAIPSDAHAAGGVFDATHWNSFFKDWKAVGVSALGAALFILALVVFIKTKSAAALFGFLLMGALAIIVGQAVVNSSSEIEKSVKTDLINGGSGRP